MDVRRRVGPAPAHVIETEVKDDISLFDARRNQVLVLNATASDIWRLCDGEQTVDEIVELLASAYGVPADDIRDEVTATLERLIEEEFLTP
ncbi:MAG TPA: PqqD family protein [Acidimicrobiia bacterium]|nr:PqqD family protein [Acidimicrobiia bacterium]